MVSTRTALINIFISSFVWGVFVENQHLYRTLFSTWLTINVFNVSSMTTTSTSHIIENFFGNNHTEIGILLQFDCANSINVIRAVRAVYCGVGSIDTVLHSCISVFNGEMFFTKILLVNIR